VNEQGIIVGCDQRQEWLLSWWWNHYSAHNKFPVAFADFGMTEKALSWCRERGQCLTLPSVPQLQEVSATARTRWENRFDTGIWFSRPAWFKKPLSLLHSPFTMGIWIDLDCQVNGMLDPLFNSLTFGGDIGLVREPSLLQEIEFLLPEEVNYNSGVVVFRKNSAILHHWADEAISNNGNYPGDQGALCRAIYKHRHAVIELPPLFNWMRTLGPNPNALIYHFVAGEGKLELLRQIDPSLEPLIEKLKNADAKC
jgi:hypothetical protein